jgi:hypothetical protein
MGQYETVFMEIETTLKWLNFADADFDNLCQTAI